MEVNFTLTGRDFLDLRALAQKLLTQGNNYSLRLVNYSLFDNGSGFYEEDSLDVNTNIYSKVLVTVIYIALFAVGCLGNSVTLYTLLTKKSLQNLQSTVHYHLASLAVSDLLILVLSMPVELYNFIWVHHPWAFGGVVCKGYYFIRDACSYATAFNIASLSVERYMAICHPFKAKSIMSRSRTKKLISGMWVASFLLASPMLFTMGQKYHGSQREKICTTIVSPVLLKIVIQVNVFLSFVVPMVAISALNGVIASQLLRMFRETKQDTRICIIEGNPTMLSIAVEPNRTQSLRHGVMVLRAVVVAFVVCYLPYYVRRLMYCYAEFTETASIRRAWTLQGVANVPQGCWPMLTPMLPTVVSSWLDVLWEGYDYYHYFFMVTNVLFYVSSAINPVLYNLVSANYREIFFNTLRCLCLPCRRKKQRRPLTRHSISICSNHTFSSNIIKETVY
ncbi:neurotensin receptor type 1-like isoform X1 [Salvelinus fontinalis]|uniref:neurotensin receptor type 1-like isoform X1 n=1 Tax=Salvelinus fontinalis TaxID=8038 RepID=UPI0024853D49|nr:neurotensin receptor type 1-like isoform X1 [Salvelinus fontinalis]